LLILSYSFSEECFFLVGHFLCYKEMVFLSYQLTFWLLIHVEPDFSFV